MRINFFGDFVSERDANNLICSEHLRSIIENADCNVLNFEGSIQCDAKPIKKQGPSLSQHPSVARWLENNKFDLLSIANNHFFDFGVDGYWMTKKNIKIPTVGGGNWDEAFRPYIVQKDGLNVAFVSFTHCEFGTLTDEWDTRHLYGTAWIGHGKVEQTILSLKNSVDFIIALPHAGIEYKEQPLPEWRDKYRLLIDIGCDAVIASHPHIIQGYEVYKGKPIFYSLGNFYFPKNIVKPDYWYRSLVVTLSLEKNRISFSTQTLKFEENYINVAETNDAYAQTYMNRIQNVLNDEHAYIMYINEICLDMLSGYLNGIRQSLGLLSPKINLKTMKEFVWLKRNRCPIETLINTIRCESHRFLLARALKLTQDIQ